jgi:hypothetical protein
MVEYLFISSVVNGIWRSLCNVKFKTYHGALVMVRSTFDWSLWIISVFDGLAHPQSWILYVQMGFNTHLYIKVLFSRESLAFRPNSHDICRTFTFKNTSNTIMLLFNSGKCLCIWRSRLKEINNCFRVLFVGYSIWLSISLFLLWWMQFEDHYVTWSLKHTMGHWLWCAVHLIEVFGLFRYLMI